ncbi:Dfr1 trimethoprim resistant dihydrofolate reductase (DHFR)e [Candida orthopsilosis Co 90-125]|uniref:Dihydrofolate reductase n=1 Tax=Candida orthopsilosis (strain 90-125) TaxID=1136231 RepID=H8XAD5_CANO9|nr:Dfr1 trimethoprim resistant dihydrofolate reductase (DHFR)e [Candida orthopsilosis Co 90-125]CCG25112.1 Dfr1 trimethoprim resistant dihydrofolate reductase (DHFR)e [Candida orthopsilosis Co 90-125]
MSKPVVTIIVAALKPLYGIGYQGSLPWRLRKEMAYFKRVTTRTSDPSLRNAVIMGRKTWDSIPSKFRPLPSRLNIILSRSFDNEVIDENLLHAKSVQDSLQLVKDKNIERVYVIGGAEIYNEFIKSGLVDNVLLTEIEHTETEKLDMDTFLKFDVNQWTKSSKSELIGFTGEEAIDDDIREDKFVYNYTLWQKQ